VAAVTDVMSRVNATQVTRTDLWFIRTAWADMNLVDAVVTVTRAVHVLVPDTRAVVDICLAGVRNRNVEAVTDCGTMR
jgi:hypothetical protein